MTNDRAPWTEVERQLLDQVFYAHPADQIRASEDLAADGLLDSLSIVVILEMLSEITGSEDALTTASADDFANLGTIRALYERL